MLTESLNKVGQVGHGRHTLPNVALTTTAMLHAYEHALKAANCSSWSYYRTTVRHFLDWCAARRQNWQALPAGILLTWRHSLANVSAAPAAQKCTHRRIRPAPSAASIYNCLCVIRHWGRWLVATNQLDAATVAAWGQSSSASSHHRVPLSRTTQTQQAAMLADYTHALQAANLAAWKYYRLTIKQFLDFAHDQGRPWPAIDASVVEHWVATLLEPDRGLKRVSVNGKINILRWWGKWLVTSGRVALSPAGDLHKLHLGTIIPRSILSVADMGKLLDNFRLLTTNDIMMKAIVELLYGSALRISEVKTLKLCDIQWSDRLITITDHKNAMIRRLPTTEAALTALLNYLNRARNLLLSPPEQAAGWFFPQRGESTIKTAINRKLKLECLRLGLPLISSHCFRHSAASQMLNKGAGIRQLQDLLGHAKISSTQVYTRVSKDQLKSVLQQFHPLELAP